MKVIFKKSVDAKEGRKRKKKKTKHRGPPRWQHRQILNWTPPEDTRNPQPLAEQSPPRRTCTPAERLASVSAEAKAHCEASRTAGGCLAINLTTDSLGPMAETNTALQIGYIQIKVKNNNNKQSTCTHTERKGPGHRAAERLGSAEPLSGTGRAPTRFPPHGSSPSQRKRSSFPASALLPRAPRRVSGQTGASRTDRCLRFRRRRPGHTLGLPGSEAHVILKAAPKE